MLGIENLFGLGLSLGLLHTRSARGGRGVGKTRAIRKHGSIFVLRRGDGLLLEILGGLLLGGGIPRGHGARDLRALVVRACRRLDGRVDGGRSGRLLLDYLFCGNLDSLRCFFGLRLDLNGFLASLCSLGRNLSLELELGLVMMLVVIAHVLGKNHGIVKALDRLLVCLVDFLVEREVDIGDLHIGNRTRLCRHDLGILLLELDIIEREGVSRNGIEVQLLGSRISQDIELLLRA